MSLYRKYRPQGFDHLVGQDHVKTILLNALKKGKIAHAYLFCGPRGTGKTSSARLIAKAVNCLNPEQGAIACNTCDRCKEALEGHMIDLIEIDAASNRGIEEIRDLREKIAFTPNVAKKKVFIIDEVHMLTKEAFNALLKTLEEPPSHAMFILATTEVHKIPATILSRCQRFDFRRVSPEVIKERLAFIAESEGLSAGEDALMLIARLSEGCLRDAISLLDQQSSEEQITRSVIEKKIGMVDAMLLEEFYQKVTSEDTASALAFTQEMVEKGLNCVQFLKNMIDTLRAKLHEAAASNDAQKLAQNIQLIEIFKEALVESKHSSIEELPLEIAVIKATSSKVPASQKTTAKVQVQPIKTTIPMEPPAPAKVDVSAEIPTGVKDEVPKVDSQPEPPQQQVAEKEGATQNSVELAQIKEQWGKVIDNVSNAVIKLSLKEVVLTGVDDTGTLFAKINSNFHLEKLKTAQASVSIEEAIQTVFGRTLRFNIQFDESVKRDVKASFSRPEDKGFHAPPVKKAPEPIAVEKMEEAVKEVFNL